MALSKPNTHIQAHSDAASDPRQRILDAAEHLLESDGLAAFSMRQVARLSGLTHQAPYHHFNDRETILAELVTRGFIELTRLLTQANAHFQPDLRLQTVIASAQAYVGFAIDHPAVFGLMFRADVCAQERFPAALEASEKAYEQLQTMVRMVHGEAAVPALATLYWGQVHGLASLIVDGPLGRQLPSTEERRAFARAEMETFARFMLGCPLKSDNSVAQI